MRVAAEDALSAADGKLMEKLDKIEYPNIQPQSFTSLDGFYAQGNHISIFGKTGSGKSVLLQRLPA